MTSLSAELFREVRPDFFRVLSGVNAAVYLDCLDALETEAIQRNEGMSREEAINIIAEILANHPGFQLEELAPVDPANPQSALPISDLPVREKARYVIDYFARTGWIEAQTSADWQRLVYFDPHGSTLLNALRKIARPDAAVFTDKLVSVCGALNNHSELASQPWEHLQSYKGNTQEGLAELRSMQKSIERFIRRQLEAQTLGQNLAVVFDQYAAQIGHTCYAELIRSHLALRLGTARERLQDLLADTDLLHKMQAEVLRRAPEVDASTAMARVRNQLEDLSLALDRVIPLADAIDARTAEFTRRSLARFRYLQEVVGERRGQVKDLFEKLNESFAGRRFSDLEEAPELPSLLLPEVRLLAGRDSLYEPPRRRTLDENRPLDDDLTPEQEERTRLQMENALRDSLTVSRANRFVQRLPGGKGTRVAGIELPILNEDDLADIIAVLLHAESIDAVYRIEVPRVFDDLPQPELIRKAACRMENFWLIKK